MRRSGACFKKRKSGAHIFEAASYSPPCWMTVSGCSAATKVAHQDNLRTDICEDFVNYLATVVKHFRDLEEIRFESLEPFNEPDGAWWQAGGRQEGYTVPFATQNALIAVLAKRLKLEGEDTVVSGVDNNNIAAAVADAAQLTPSAPSALGRLKLKQYKALAQKLHKPIWMSELGCCFPNQGDKTGMWGALFMADGIRMDLRDRGAESWVLWPPDWNVIAFDPLGGKPQLKNSITLSRSTHASFAPVSRSFPQQQPTTRLQPTSKPQSGWCWSARIGIERLQ